MSLVLASIHVYPVKSLGGYTLNEVDLTDRGPEHDRRWMLVDRDGRFLSQREVPAMACLHCSPGDEGFIVTDVRDGAHLRLPWEMHAGRASRVRIWEDEVVAIAGPAAASEWFTERLRTDVDAMYMPHTSHRAVDPTYAEGTTSLSDGFPYLIVSASSLDELNRRGAALALERGGHWSPIPMERFRPNLVIGGGVAHQEDGWTEIRIGSARFNLVKPCARCVITTTDQSTGTRGAEPLRTLATYRAAGNKVLFAMNAMGDQHGTVRVGDRVTLPGDEAWMDRTDP